MLLCDFVHSVANYYSAVKKCVCFLVVVFL